MELMKVKLQVLNLELAVVDVDTRFCTPTEFNNTATKDIITNPSWSWHPCYPSDKYLYTPRHYTNHIVHCQKLGTLTKTPQMFRTSLVDDDAIMMKLTEYTIRGYMKSFNGTVDDNEGYIVWLSDDEDFIIERVWPDKAYSAFFPLRIDGKPYPDYEGYIRWNN